MTVLATHRYEDRVSLLDMVERSLHLGVRTFGPRPVPAEVVESLDDATAEAYVTGTTRAGDAIRVHLELGFGTSTARMTAAMDMSAGSRARRCPPSEPRAASVRPAVR